MKGLGMSSEMVALLMIRGLAASESEEKRAELAQREQELRDYIAQYGEAAQVAVLILALELLDANEAQS